jgi:diguanylate cyclase (GGDEF)-like protein/PAS domain S-box-containing protein
MVRNQQSKPPGGGVRIVDLLAVFGVAVLVSAVCLTFVLAEPLVQMLAVGSATALLIPAMFFRRARELARQVAHGAEAELALEESEERYRELFENANDMVYTHDLEGNFTSMNRAGERLTGYTAQDVARINLTELVAPADRKRARELIAKSADGEATPPFEVELVTKQGRSVPVEVSMRAIVLDERPLGVQGIARDVTERRRFEQQLVRLASHDPLTGLFNRRRFEDELQLQMSRARRTATTGTLLFIDLDHFKDVNDSLGHTAGDELLAEVSRLLSDQLQKTGIIARLGGDEFTAILPQTDHEEARRISEEILTRLRNAPFKVAGQAFSVTASIGIASISTHGAFTADELLSQADAAMYQAKENGRNRVCIYSAETDWQAQTESRLRWRRRIWDAIENNRFVVYGQPIMDLRVEQPELCQFELLLRLSGAGGENVEADAIVDNAARFGFMQEIDRWVVSQGIELLATYASSRPELVLEVNLSSGALSDGELLRMIRRDLEDSAIDPSRLVLEVTERAAIANLDLARRFIADLKGIGCRFALDDFGVGFSSFHQLKYLDVDYLKIDGSFVRNLPNDPVDQHLVKAIVEVSRALGKETIAEFVTDEATIEVLRSLGVDYAQGYHIGEPEPIEDVLGRLSEADAEAA